MQRASRAALALGWWWLAGAHAQQSEQERPPDLDFLEYLGAWAEGDEEWLAIEEWRKDNAEDVDRREQEREQEREEQRQKRENDEDDESK
jgi:hypothetical protein